SLPDQWHRRRRHPGILRRQPGRRGGVRRASRRSPVDAQRVVVAPPPERRPAGSRTARSAANIQVGRPDPDGTQVLRSGFVSIHLARWLLAVSLACSAPVRSGITPGQVVTIGDTVLRVRPDGRIAVTVTRTFQGSAADGTAVLGNIDMEAA